MNHSGHLNDKNEHTKIKYLNNTRKKNNRILKVNDKKKRTFAKTNTG